MHVVIHFFKAIPGSLFDSELVLGIQEVFCVLGLTAFVFLADIELYFYFVFSVFMAGGTSRSDGRPRSLIS